MTKPLTVKRPAVASIPEQILIGIFVIGPLAGLGYCWQTHQDLHVDNPSLNLAIYLGIFFIPLLWAWFMNSRPLNFEETDEISLGTCSTIQKWPLNWWTMFVMWAAPAFGIIIGTYNLVTNYLSHRESLSMSPGSAVVVMIVMWCLGMFYFTLLLGRSDIEVRLAPEGLRMSLMRFHQWADLHHVSEHGDLYAIYHRANPALSAGTLKVRDENARAALLKALADHQIPLSNAVAPQLARVKLVVIAGFLAILTGVLWLQFHTRISSLWLTVMAFGAGVVFTFPFERYRGIPKYAKHKPIISSNHDDTATISADGN